MNSRSLLQIIKNRIDDINRNLNLAAHITIADTPAQANAILSNAMSAQPAICIFITSDTSVAEVFEDTHMIARISIGIVSSKPLESANKNDTFSILDTTDQLRVALSCETFDEFIVPNPIFTSMEYIHADSGRFLNGYLLNFDCHYNFN